MSKIRSIEADKWSEPDEKGRVSHIGMKAPLEVFEKLKGHLDKNGLLPDEYFLMNRDLEQAEELPDYGFAYCIPNFGGSEGVYLDIYLEYTEDGRTKRLDFLTGKTLREGADAFDWMARIAAECSLMLNGRGCSYERENKTLVQSEGQAEYLRRFLWQEACRTGECGMEELSEIVKMLG